MKLEQLAQVVNDHVPQQVKPVFDLLALLGWISALAGFLTTIFALVAAIASAGWWVLRLYDSKRVQDWLKRRSK